MKGWILRKTVNHDADVRLFCFPHAGGGASAYSGWAAELPRVEVCPVQLPGHENRAGEPLLRSIRDMATAAATELYPLFDRPFALFGHSMGSLIAFDLARILRARNAPQPFLLIASGHCAPDVPLQRARIYDRPHDEFVAELSSMEGTPPEILEDEDMLSFFLPPLRADFEACDCYTYVDEPPLDVPILAMGGLGDTCEPWPHVAAWERHTNAPFDLRLFDGGHFFLHRHRRRIFDEIRRAIDSAHAQFTVPQRKETWV
jgi:surfactin synthase thioesterase subunit